MGQKKYTVRQQAIIVARLMRRCVEISETTLHDVFCYYSPHVKWFSIKFFYNGWECLKPYDKEVCIDFNDWNNYTAEKIAEAERMLDELQKGEK